MYNFYICWLYVNYLKSHVVMGLMYKCGTRIYVDSTCVNEEPKALRAATVNGTSVYPLFSPKTWKGELYGMMTFRRLSDIFPTHTSGGLYICLELENIFQSNFRMERDSFADLCSTLRPRLQRSVTRFRDPISVEQQVAVTLHHLAHGGSYHNLENLFAIGHSPACKVVQWFS
ncbi:hypothetical protein VOLCADRAFT_105032 [Volvox carteri f. nagariensis]|uniref:DDE Tnp4 domain-containing protein n=1 Tax=Volvox carteri f. nagariensis TaxID=3068 RepID=D8TXX2_VOLCA|nr:uncharacterized protein VOLCADRAFT_105032 [Volvox carteri f. nagariensis]EFJ47795.1 hypothetical protein VOLCADRAFT_105032 [Volvox carteri f. nagariensis]|eukprot:XP_002951266.1 hypothetical protein VOLCADRAFT_105032 [Volvox carteri f. nagariensis]